MFSVLQFSLAFPKEAIGLQQYRRLQRMTAASTQEATAAVQATSYFQEVVVGIQADVHGANNPKGQNFEKTELRYHQHAAELNDTAGKAFQKKANELGKDRFMGVLDFGDKVDQLLLQKKMDAAKKKIKEGEDKKALCDGLRAVQLEIQTNGTAVGFAEAIVAPLADIMDSQLQISTADKLIADGEKELEEAKNEIGEAFKTVCSAYGNLPRDDVIGNHELALRMQRHELKVLLDKHLGKHPGIQKYCFPDSTSDPLREYFKSEGKNLVSYTRRWGKHYMLVVLDSYADSTNDGCDQEERAEADKFLMENNKKFYENKAANRNWFDGVADEDKKFVAYNGGIGKDQRDWFKAQLQKAKAEQRYVIVATHVQALYESCRNHKTLLWDNEAVRQIIAENDHVLAYFSGHTHCAGIARDQKTYQREGGEGYLSRCLYLNVPSPMVGKFTGRGKEEDLLDGAQKESCHGFLTLGICGESQRPYLRLEGYQEYNNDVKVLPSLINADAGDEYDEKNNSSFKIHGKKVFDLRKTSFLLSDCGLVV